MGTQTINSTQQIINAIGTVEQAETLCILGSGWNHVIDQLTVTHEWSFETVFGVQPTVPGHCGKLLLSWVANKPVIFMAGRLHTYEGYPVEAVTRPIQALAQLGVKQLIITSASGGLNETYRVGDLVVLSDILTLYCQSPLGSPQFQDLSQPFNPDLRSMALEILRSHTIPFQEGVYTYTKGPHYESFSDKKALRILGADCVGMSTIPETIMANALGLDVLGLSCITNLAFVKHNHEEVIANAEKNQRNMVTLLLGILERINK